MTMPEITPESTNPTTVNQQNSPSTRPTQNSWLGRHFQELEGETNDVANASRKRIREEEVTPKKKQSKIVRNKPQYKFEPKVLFDSMPRPIQGITKEYVGTNISISIILDLLRDKVEIQPYWTKGITELNLANECLRQTEIIKLLESCDDIKTLTLPENADDSVIKLIAKKFPGIEYLDISRCDGITEDGIKIVSENFKSASVFHNHRCDLTAFF